MKVNIGSILKPCSKEDSLKLVKLAMMSNVVLSLSTDLIEDKNPLLKNRFKSIVERDLENILEHFSNDFLINMNKADEKAVLKLLKMFYDFNNKIVIKEKNVDITNGHLLVSYCAAMYRVIHRMGYRDRSVNLVKNVSHKIVTTYNTQFSHYADMTYEDKNLLEVLTDAIYAMSETILYS
ncbi:MAG: hypothetical protein RIR01_2268 [Bacteroidota bacterium]|jgi:hypothetical protein